MFSPQMPPLTLTNTGAPLSFNSPLPSASPLPVSPSQIHLDPDDSVDEPYIKLGDDFPDEIVMKWIIEELNLPDNITELLDKQAAVWTLRSSSLFPNCLETGSTAMLCEVSVPPRVAHIAIGRYRKDDLSTQNRLVANFNGWAEIEIFRVWLVVYCTFKLSVSSRFYEIVL